jgi:hypothetical protein
MDIIQDNRLLLNNKDDHQILRTVFADYNCLFYSNILQFSFYATMVKKLIKFNIIYK